MIEQWEDEIRKGHEDQMNKIDALWGGSDPVPFEKAELYEKDVIKKAIESGDLSNLPEHLQKSLQTVFSASKDGSLLKLIQSNIEKAQKLSGGRWVTIDGRHVYIGGDGEVKAGVVYGKGGEKTTAGGVGLSDKDKQAFDDFLKKEKVGYELGIKNPGRMNELIDKFKKEQGGEKKEKPVNERSPKEIGEAKQKIADTMPKPINEMTWEEFKPFGIKMQKQSSHSQPESFYERGAKTEHDWAIKNNKSQYAVKDDDTTDNEALKSLEKMGHKMPTNAMIEKEKKNLDRQKKNELTEGDKKYFKENKKDVMAILDDDVLMSVQGAITKHKSDQKEHKEYVDKFVGIAKKSKDGKDFYNKAGEIKMIPKSVGNWFSEAYPESTPQKASQKFVDDVKAGKFSKK